MFAVTPRRLRSRFPVRTLCSRILLAAICLSGPLFAAIPGRPMAPSYVLATFSVANSAPLAALERLSAYSHVPFGIEWIQVVGSGITITATWRHEKVEAIARDILARAAGPQAYVLAARGLVLEIRPAARLRASHSLADIRISHFETGGWPGLPNSAIPIVQASTLLSHAAGTVALPQFHPATGVIAITGGTEIGTCAPLLSWDDSTVAEILDGMISITCTGKQIWVMIDDPHHTIADGRYWTTRNFWAKGWPIVPPALEPSIALISWRRYQDGDGNGTSGFRRP